MKTIKRKSEVIGVDKDAFFYLKDRMRKERGCKPMSEEAKELNWLKIYKNSDGLKELDDRSLGGGDGTYNGKWWRWDVNMLRKMLKDGGFSWVEYGEIETTESYL